MGTPLVSVMVVAHDAEKTLGFALASVLAQTVPDWECVVVDDGSPHPAAAIVEAMRDDRFRCLDLGQNRGRGYARQRGLEAARGRMLAILDADDWMYPERLETELACLRSEPRAMLVGSSMAVEDGAHRISGVQDVGHPGRRKLGVFPFSFAPMLAEVSFVRDIGFDPRLTRSEDVLFLARALRYPWVCVPSPLYAYHPSVATRASSLEGYRCTRMAYAECRSSDPIGARRLELAYGLREVVHHLSPEPVRRRLSAWSRQRVLRLPTPAERREHARALGTVTRLAESRDVLASAADSGW